MKFRNPYGKWGKWRDDITPREKIVWSVVSVIIGVTLGMILNRFGITMGALMSYLVP